MSVKVGNVLLGDGKLKVCVPIVAEKYGDIIAQAESIANNSSADLAELRLDWYENALDEKAACELACAVKKKLLQKPLLVTFRSGGEGGMKEIGVEAYDKLLEVLARSGAADMLDVEQSMVDAGAKEIVGSAHAMSIPVLMSMHDFDKTPCCEELKSRFEGMLLLGADICKAAVMPQSMSDVARLLKVTADVKAAHPDAVLVTMAMGSLGVVSRICGGVFGSAMTFAALGRASAPGQAAADSVKKLTSELEKLLL